MKCRICKNKLFSNPILELRGMPVAAQHFLNKNQLHLDKKKKIDIFQCKTCGLVQLKIKPVSYYKDVITAASISGDTKKLRLNQMNEFSEKFGLKNKKVIEIGCGKGSMLDIIEQAGMRSYGIENSKKSVLFAKKYKRNVLPGYITDITKLKSAPFDAFICFNFLEHAPNPKLFINKIFDNLNENGVGLVTVPNLDYLIKTKSFYEFVSDHLSYFTKNTLKFAFENNKFKVLSIDYINNKNDIIAVVKKSNQFKPKKKINVTRLKLGKEFNEVENLIKTLKEISKKYQKNKKKIAIWGAGHRTLALLSLSKFKKIEYIVDSAKFKQGKYSPINHNKIVPPETLKRKKIDLLIVMVPGIYPDEVIKTVKRMNLNLKIAKLEDNRIIFI